MRNENSGRVWAVLIFLAHSDALEYGEDGTCGVGVSGNCLPAVAMAGRGQCPGGLLIPAFQVCLSFQVFIEKQKGEILGVVIVESGWGSILPTVIIANMMHGGPAEKSGKLNIGDQIMSINGTSLVGLPLSTCQSIIKVPGGGAGRGEGSGVHFCRRSEVCLQVSH